MTPKEAIDIIRYTFLNVDNHLNDGSPERSAQDIHDALVLACSTLCNHSLPSNLDEAAKEIGTDILGKDYLSELDEDCAIDALNEAITLVKAGAKWMAGQEVIIMQGTVDEACYSNLSELLDRDDLSADEEIELFFRKK